VATLDNTTSSTHHWLWTGVRNLNQIWSYFYVPEPIFVTGIDVYWGGYDKRTEGKHFIAKWHSGDGKNLDGLIVASNTISVPQGRGWRHANVKRTYLDKGGYAVGIWGSYTGRRTTGLWNGDRGGATYVDTQSKLNGTAIGKMWTAPNIGGGLVLPCRLIYEPAGIMHVKVNGSWRDGKPYVKVNGVWRQAKQVFVKSNGTWRRGE